MTPARSAAWGSRRSCSTARRCHAAWLRFAEQLVRQADDENLLSRLPLSAREKEIIQQAIWLYLRFTLSLRDVTRLKIPFIAFGQGHLLAARKALRVGDHFGSRRRRTRLIFFVGDIEPLGHRRCRHGTKSSLRRESDVPGDLLCAQFGNVTEPLHG